MQGGVVDFSLLSLRGITRSRTTTVLLPQCIRGIKIGDGACKAVILQLNTHVLDNTEALPSVLVAGTGTAAANGVYTFRGYFGGKPFYNKVGTLTSPGESSISWRNSEWEIRGSDSTIFYVAGNNTDFPYPNTWETADGAEPPPTVTEIPNIVTASYFYWGDSQKQFYEVLRGERTAVIFCENLEEVFVRNPFLDTVNIQVHIYD